MPIGTSIANSLGSMQSSSVLVRPRVRTCSAGRRHNERVRRRGASKAGFAGRVTMSRQFFGVGAVLGAIVISVLVAVGVGVVPAAAQEREPAQALPRAPSPAIDPFLVDLQDADVSVLLGDRQPSERPDPGPLSDAVLLQHRRRGLRAHHVSGRRRARVHHARAGAAADARDPAIPRRRAAGPRCAGPTGYQGFFYHFLDMKTGAPVRG